MGVQVGELFVALGFKMDDKELKQFNSAIDNTGKLLTKASVAAAGAVWAINRFVAKAIDESEALTRFKNTIGGTSDEVQRLHRAAQDFNTSFTLDDAMATFKSFRQMIDDARYKGNYQENLLKLGVGNISYDNPMELLMKIREAYKRYPQEFSRAQVREMGHADLIPLLESSDEKFHSAMSQYVPSDSQIDAWYKASQAIVKFTRAFNDMRMSMGESYSPMYIGFLENMTALVVWAGDKISWFGDVWSSMGSKAKTALKLVALGISAVVSAFVPLLWIPTVGAAILMTFDNLGELLKSGSTFLQAFKNDLMVIPNLIRDLLGWIGRLSLSISSKIFSSEEGGLIGNWKKRISEKWGTGKTDSDLGIYPRGSRHTSSTNNQGNLTYAPTVNVSTNATGIELTTTMNNVMDSQFSRAYSAIGGARSGLLTGAGLSYRQVTGGN